MGDILPGNGTMNRAHQFAWFEQASMSNEHDQLHANNLRYGSSILQRYDYHFAPKYFYNREVNQFFLAFCF